MLIGEQFGEYLGNLLRALHSNSTSNSGLEKLLSTLLVEDGLLVKDDSTQIPMLNYSGTMQLQEVQEIKPSSSRA